MEACQEKELDKVVLHWFSAILCVQFFKESPSVRIRCTHYLHAEA